MLPTRLLEVKNKLVAKGIVRRTAAEDELLAELEAVDNVVDQQKLTKDASFSESRMTSGPSDKCSCCGR